MRCLSEAARFYQGELVLPYPIASVGFLVVAALLTWDRYCGIFREDIMIFPSLAVCSTRVRVTLRGEELMWPSRVCTAALLLCVVSSSAVG